VLYRYEDVVYTPGPIGALAVVVSVLALVLARRHRLAVALFTGTGLLLLVVPMMTVDFDYRYVLSSLQLVVVGGALAGSTLARRVRWRRGARPGLAVAVTAGALAANLAVPQAYASGTYTITHYAGADATALPAGGRYAAWLTTPRLESVRCIASRWRWLYSMQLTVEWRHGDAVMAAVDNLSLHAGRYVAHVVATAAPNPEVFNPAVLSAAHPSDSGTVLFYLARPEGRLRVRYVDPLGAGFVGWALPLAADPTLPAPGSGCFPARLAPRF
jgi:hypothetical protein